MDPFELLKADHRKVAQLFDQLEAASEKAKLDVFRQIKAELDLHTHVEETVFYPALERPEETKDITLEAYEEHKVVKTLLAELDGARAADDEWQAQAKVLRENVEHHVDEEEGEMFDKAEDVLSAEELDQLGDQMAMEKERQGRPVEMTEAKNRPGILTRIASAVGLGGSKKEASKGRSAKKAAAASKSSKGRAAASKASKKTSAKKAATATKKKATRSQKAAGKKAPGRSSKSSASVKGTRRVAAARGTPKRAKKSSKTGARKGGKKAGRRR